MGFWGGFLIRQESLMGERLEPIFEANSLDSGRALQLCVQFLSSSMPALFCSWICCVIRRTSPASFQIRTAPAVVFIETISSWR
jgi:hypothetical protein